MKATLGGPTDDIRLRIMQIFTREMKRRVRFKLTTPHIELKSWKPASEDALTFSYKQDDIVGTVFVSLDDKAIAWDGRSGYLETGEPWEVVEPIACSRIVVCVEGCYSDVESADTGTPSASTTPTSIPGFLGKPEGEKPVDVKFLVVAHRLAIEYASRFIYYLKSELGQYWVDLGQVRDWGMWTFLTQTGARWIDDNGVESEIKVPPFAHLAEEEDQPGAVFQYGARNLDESHWLDMQRSLERGALPEVATILLSDAKQCLANGDYRMASVEAISALESKLVRFVEQRCKERGISNQIWKDYGKGSIAAYLKFLLPLVLRQTELESVRDAIERCLRLNGVRNKVVHEGDDPISKKEVIEQGIEAVECMLGFVQAAETNTS